MQRKTFLTLLALAFASVGVAPTLAKADWPTQPIRLLTASAASGNAYIAAQIVAQELEKRL
jgi:tripartite-type tricarboxylate transporter receptor subunit TctC